jgi:NADPH-dependent F420 reductase
LPTVAPLADLIGDHLVISVGTAIMKKGREFLAITPPRGSVTALLQSALPNARVVGACHHLPARPLRDLEASMDSDVLVCSDHLGAAEETVALLSVIEGVRAFYAGSLAAASTVEAMTAVLVTLNIRHKALTTLKIGGLGEPRL